MEMMISPNRETTPDAAFTASHRPARRRMGSTSPRMLAAMLLACGSVACAVAPAHAQQDAHTLLRIEAAANPVVVDSLSFEGGTMGDLIESLRASFEAEDRPFNVITRRDAARIPVGPLSLRRVTPGAAIQVSVDQWGQWTDKDGDELVHRYRAFEVVQGPFGEPVYVLDGWESRSPMLAIDGQDPVEVRVVPLGDAVGMGLTGGGDERKSRLRTAMDALEAAVGFSRLGGVETLVHEETMLLFVRGPQGEVERIRPVLEQAISEIARQLRTTLAASHPSDLRAEYRKQWERRERARARLPMLEAELAELRKLREQGAIPDRELREAEYRVREASIEVAVASDGLQELAQGMADRGVPLPTLWSADDTQKFPQPDSSESAPR